MSSVPPFNEFLNSMVTLGVLDINAENVFSKLALCIKNSPCVARYNVFSQAAAAVPNSNNSFIPKPPIIPHISSMLSKSVRPPNLVIVENKAKAKQKIITPKIDTLMLPVVTFVKSSKRLHPSKSKNNGPLGIGSHGSILITGDFLIFSDDETALDDTTTSVDSLDAMVDSEDDNVPSPVECMEPGQGNLDECDVEPEYNGHGFGGNLLILYGSGNLLCSCYWLLFKIFNSTLAPKDGNDKYAFIIRQTPKLTHICCRELNYAVGNGEISFNKLREILVNKACMCCILENFDALDRNMQLKVSQIIAKAKDKFFVITTLQLWCVDAKTRSLGLAYRVKPLDKDKCVDYFVDCCQVKTQGQITPCLTRLHIREIVQRSHHDLVLLHKSIVAAHKNLNATLRKLKGVPEQIVIARRLLHFILYEAATQQTIATMQKNVYTLFVVVGSYSLNDLLSSLCQWLVETGAVNVQDSIHQVYRMFAKVYDGVNVTRQRIATEILIASLAQLLNTSGANTNKMPTTANSTPEKMPKTPETIQVTTR